MRLPPGLTDHDSGLAQDVGFLTNFGFDPETLRGVERRARSFGCKPAEVLFASGLVTQDEYYRCLAFELGIEFVAQTPADLTPFYSPPSPKRMRYLSRMIRIAPEHGQTANDLLHLAPDCTTLDELKAFLAAYPTLRKRLRITTPRSNIASLEERSSPSLLKRAIHDLRDRYSEFSARRVITAAQGVTLLLFLQLLVVLSFASSASVVLGLHLAAGFFYIGCIALRLAAAVTFDPATRQLPHPEEPPDRSQDHTLPVYSVLVAVYNEAGQIDDLVDALLRLDWPRERLDIKIICEADDLATIAAVRSALLRVRTSCVTLVEVPTAHPRTKPKALNFALPLCSGQLLVIYDAEDRPNPLQLREAHARFVAEGPDLACLQAPLIIHNHREKWVSRLFAAEYSALFDGLLPMLARIGAPIPLGGTSNHFRTAVLRHIGAWDPYNVTEDADLGIRLSRAGCRIGVLARPTYEEAPIDLLVWLKQRTRWFKGWYQTMLVHMRHPVDLFRDLGLRNAVLLHLLVTGMIVSALIHPLIVYFLIARSLEMIEHGYWYTLSKPLFQFDLFTILAGYGFFALLAWRTLPVRRLAALRPVLWLVPVYWMMLSAAAWRAVWHLILRPHSWEKTPHRLRLKR